MKLEFYYDSTVEPFKLDDFDMRVVLRLLKKLEEKDIDIVIHDTAGWDDAMRMEHYLRGVVPAMRKKYGIRRVFGSARICGWLFGRQVPALIVQEGEEDVDIYPHQLAGKRDTLLSFLKALVSKIGERRRR